ncbi:MAG: excinuclease ABC subunit UvrA [Desulfobacterales bacterium]|jgi:excinuclease ABC subunit A
MNVPSIEIIGARQNNLKDLDLYIPLNRLTVISGVSGSGKSSLAIDTLYAEGQRRYVETFSPYARQFMDRMDRPRVKEIRGIPPAIAIDQKDPVRTSRSTVGTMTEITDYVKLLFPRLGILHCASCGVPVTVETPARVWHRLNAQPEGTRAVITFSYPSRLPDIDGAEHPFRHLVRLGFDRCYIGGRVVDLMALNPEHLPETIEVLVDRLVLRDNERQRVIDSIEMAYRFGKGRLTVHLAGQAELSFSSRLECPRCQLDYSAPLPNMFSFNSPIGACDTCRGFGRTIGIDMELIIPEPSLSLKDGAVKPWGHRYSNPRAEYTDLMEFCGRMKIPTDVPFHSLSTMQQQSIIDGTDDYYGIRGFFKWLESKTYKMPVRVFLSRYRSYDVCKDCKGARFKPETLLYRINGCTIADIYAMDIDRAGTYFDAMDALPQDEADRMVLDEIKARIRYLQDVGLGYLTIDRQSRTLSGGEVQRVALASALGSSLVNTLYVLDEPSIGLHPRDNRRLIRLLKRLRDQRNTVVVVEHDPEIIKESDFLMDMGPGAGEKGGQVMYFGPTGQVDGSPTGGYLTGKRRIEVPATRRPPRSDHWLSIKGAAANNLKSIDVGIPLGLFVCLTGVSGSGKSTLAEDILFKAAARSLGVDVGRPGAHRRLLGSSLLSDVALVDQRGIGRTPRANVLTYTGAMSPVRQLLAETPDAKERGFGPGTFSFNISGGRCETCKGDGFEKVEMQFLSDVYISCPDCKGRRFKPEVLAIRYRGKSVDDILNLTVSEALELFRGRKAVEAALGPLTLVGLGYIRLGQPINTFSGGEAQRLKLSRFLSEKKPPPGKTRLLIFDEPTTGLHFDDIATLLKAMQSLVDAGDTVLVIEHNMDVVKAADWVIDLGPEGGDKGGLVVAEGPPEALVSVPESHTGAFLSSYLDFRSFTMSTTADVRETTTDFGKAAAAISINGAREHNLKNIALDIPHQRFVALTGVSGSGKSTLAFDIIFAEGQRRYLESLAPYVRQYMKILERPDVDLVTGLAPTVAIEQRVSHSSRRSTVATLTEIYHFLRLLYSKLGVQHCLGCDRPLTTRSEDALIEEIRKRFGRKRSRLLAPKVSGRKGYHKDIFSKALKDGFREARIDGDILPIENGMRLSRYHEHTVEIVIGRSNSGTIDDTVRLALDQGEGSLIVRHGGEDHLYSRYGVCPTCGIGVTAKDPRLFSFNSSHGACGECDGLGETADGGETADRKCPVCEGSRLRPEALGVKIDGLSIWDMVQMPPSDLDKTLKKLRFPVDQSPIAMPVIAEITGRLSLINRLGLSYLALSRSGNTLSGGEAQRVRLAAQLGSNLRGVTYVLDEPTIGLHPRDNTVLVKALTDLRDRGNTVIVVEHDEETIRAADAVIDLGPGAGELGGAVVATGSVGILKQTPESVTGAFLEGGRRRITSKNRPINKRKMLTVHNARTHNLKNISVGFPLGCLIALSGVSGSGKSSLLKETVYKNVRNHILGRSDPAGSCRRVTGWTAIQRIVEVDHSPIGKTPRSVPASYVGFLTDIRRLFSMTPEAKSRGYEPGRFSFNIDGGRCDACKGQGQPKVKMSFLPDVYVPCDACRGSRFNTDTLSVSYRGQTIADVLNMSFAQALRFFSAVPAIRRPVEFVCTIGLGYLKLGQPSPTLSGGEAQRMKLARELASPGSGHTLFVLDEPTTGLHRSDVELLLTVLQDLVDRDNTVAVIEHNMDVIRAADYIIDVGPEGGAGGGQIVARGTPERMLGKAGRSHTARYLKRYLEGNTDPD